MTHIPAIDVNSRANKTATYNAVKIQINDPRTNIPEGHQSSIEDNGTYNAVAIEVNRPSVNMDKHRHNIYSYPQADCPICADMAGFHPINTPKLPIAYQTTNFINNRTYIGTEVEVEKKLTDAINAINASKSPEAEIIEEKKHINVPQPNFTTTEAEKENINFNGLSFRADNKKSIEIVPPQELKPEINLHEVINNLSNDDFDMQARQMEEIARVSMEDSEKAIPYIVTEVFSELINIVEKDTTSLTPPSEKQIEIRKQIIINEIVKEQAKTKQEDSNKVELPYKIDENDIKIATTLSSLEQAERNKEYALYTMAILSKVYTDEVQKQTGNIVPLTDLPGVSSIVDTLRHSSNSGVKVAAIDALRYINRPEYKEELSAVLALAADDTNPYVAQNAAVALESMN